MHPCMLLLDEAFEVAKQEEQALATEDVDQIEALSTKRADLLAKAWDQRKDMDEEELKNRLQEMQAVHEKLTTTSKYLHESIRSQLNTRRKQNGYLAGAKSRTAHANKSFYLSKTS